MVAVAMRFAMKNGKICSLRKFLAISPAIQEIASDCGCDAVVHLGPDTFDHDKGQKSAISGHRLHCELEAKKAHKP